MKRLLLVLVTSLAAGCGSEFHAPGESISMPSSVDVGPSSDHRPGDVKSSDDQKPGSDSRVPTTMPVFAHYVSWHTVPGGWAQASMLPLFRDAGAEMGYTSHSDVTIRHHVPEMAANGILPMVSWWSKDSYAGDRFLHKFLSIPGPQIAILYEAVGPGRMQINNVGNVARLAQGFGPPPQGFASLPEVSRSTVAKTAEATGINMGDAVNADIFINDMAHLQTNFFDRYPDRFYRIEGRPVVFIWISHAFYGPFDKVVERARERSAFYLWGSEFTTPWGMAKGHESVIGAMDAITSYGFYDDARYGRSIDERFLKDYGAAINEWGQWLANHRLPTKIVPPMGYSYDETRIPGRTGFVFDSSYEMARAYAEKVRGYSLDPCGSGRVLPMAYITSYNEHYEGSALEPSDLYQDNYLRIIREVFAVPRAVSEDRAECGDDGENGEGKDHVVGE